jgi:hypothetical protein
MSNKTLNKANLEKLGADNLAGLVTGRAKGQKDVAADLRTR